MGIDFPADAARAGPACLDVQGYVVTVQSRFEGAEAQRWHQPG